METEVRKGIPDSIAKIISVIFHPLFMPVFGLAVILSGDSPFGYLPVNLKRMLYLIFMVNNVLLPLSLLPFFRQMNFITSWTIKDRKERIMPLLTTTILYAATYYIIYRLPIPIFIKSFVFSTFILSLLTTLINLRWKISLHSIGAGGLIAIMLYMIFKMSAPIGWQLILAILAGGMVLSSRLSLNLHNSLEVWSGFFVGFTGLTGLILIFQ